MRRFLASLAPLALLPSLVAGAAYAHGDPAAAQALFDDARQLMAQGRYVEACPKLEESQRLDPGLGTELNMASCYEHVGRVASAWATFLAVAAESRAAGQEDRARIARERAAALQGSVPKVLLLVRAVPPPGLEITRDGAPVGRGQIGLAVPIDPGSHVIVATAPGHLPWRGAVDVPNAPGTVTVNVPALENAPPPPPSVAPALPRGVTNTMPVDSGPPEPSHRGRGQLIAGALVGVLALGGVGTGIVMGLESKTKRDDASAHCVGNSCDASGVGLRHDAVVDGNVATVAFSVGGAALLGAIILWATAPSSTAPATGSEASIHAAPMVGRGVTGFGLTGQF